MRTYPYGNRITGFSSLAVLVAFFLPWMLVSCSSLSGPVPLVTVSGYQLARGGEVMTTMGETGDLEEGEPQLFAIPVAVMLIALLAYFGAGLQALGLGTIVTQALLALLAIGNLVALYLEYRNDLQSDINVLGSDLGNVWVTAQYGLYLTVFAMVGLTVGLIMSLAYHLKPDATTPASATGSLTTGQVRLNRHCTGCGAAVDNAGHFCPNCGRALASQTP